eukprot:CAMPEP_0168532400 /NCGR_PEP_ID=MMETSP0405-20121227/16211_1 /TAXON_ID=498012 /ORGANISM="Trichosphaerium sp, Strain Am-I-7 wt" /LENGTH=412 /DNA_ID=CAMNT_0008557767 /DNA_START=18 /DNA_END=1256 /DNA_ORIENTATION=-
MDALEKQINSLSDRLEGVSSRLKNVESALASDGTTVKSAGVKATPEQATNFAEEWDKTVGEKVKAYAQLSKTIGGEVASQSELVVQAFQQQRQLIIESASASTQPLQERVAPLTETMKSIGKIAEENRKHRHFNHLMACQEGIAALGWIVMPEKPQALVDQGKESSQFYTDKILREHKGKVQAHVQFVADWTDVLKTLRDYVAKYYSGGMVWNEQGGQTAIEDTIKVETIGEAPEATTPKRQSTTTKQTKAVVQKEARTYKRGNKIFVENYVGRKDIKIEAASQKQNFYIYNCNDCAIKIIGKVNNLMIESCKKSGVEFDSSISAVEVIRCESMKIMCLKVAPAVQIDHTSGLELYLSKESLDADIFTTCTENMNVLVPKGDEGDWTEIALPQQYQLRIVNGKIESRPVVTF